MSFCPVHPNHSQKRENYYYNRNEPKNEQEYRLDPIKSKEWYSYKKNEAKNQEFYNYGYSYANYKKKADNTQENFSGVF